MAHEASLKCPLHWPERGRTAPAMEKHCETYRAFRLAVIAAREIKSPIVTYDPQISKPELMRCTKWGKKIKRHPNQEWSTEVLKDLLTVMQGFGESQKPSTDHPSLAIQPCVRLLLCNTFKSFSLCFSHFSPSFPTPRVHLKYSLAWHIIQTGLLKH